ncbi:MAG: recombinase family protein [Nitrospiraceae bacterium]|nr:MAG: recombinase family protein [Nitrospiraceae bacterium]
MLSITNFGAEMEREKAKQRTYDAMLRKAKAGHVTGGKVYGYDNKEVMTSDGRRLHVLRIITPPKRRWSAECSKCTPHAWDSHGLPKP